MALHGQAVKVEGLIDVQRALKAADGESQKMLRLVFNDAATEVADRASSLIPSRSGRARRSVRAASTQREGRVKGGGARVRYYPWLDFGGSVGRRASVKRPFLKEGRYIYASYARVRPRLVDMMEEGLNELVKSAGLDGGT